ncbi:hypothetical protein Q644_25375 [Brucella intermedia 229E]|uniref:Uncharacterized protein n=1 Tax=Brucella intermedia 229E TaxID=1337887 RepID=U4V3Y1_9HYPH|nr:hypothetical protein Q644_25375 [Brucella intermedia 229E]
MIDERPTFNTCRTDRQQVPPGWHFTLVFGCRAHIGPAECVIGNFPCDVAKQLKARIVEHPGIMPDIHMPHDIAHPRMRDADKGNKTAHRATDR